MDPRLWASLDDAGHPNQPGPGSGIDGPYPRQQLPLPSPGSGNDTIQITHRRRTEFGRRIRNHIRINDHDPALGNISSLSRRVTSDCCSDQRGADDQEDRPGQPMATTARIWE